MGTSRSVACKAAIAGWLVSLLATDVSSAPIEEHVTFENEDALLSGTLVIPDNAFPAAAIVLIHGAGPQQRMLPLARLFASDSIAVLTYDKRGVGESGGVYEGPNNIGAANLNLLAGDAAAALRLLVQHPKLAGVPAGFVGISQAGWIAPIAATKVQPAFMALWSGPTCTVSEELHFSDLAEKDPKFWSNHSADDVKMHMQGVRYRTDDVDPRTALSKLSIPGLWIFGSQDNSIPVDLSVERLQELITDDKPFEYRIFPELGHGLVDATYPFLMGWVKRQGAVPKFQVRSDWARYFAEAGVAGAIVVSDERAGHTWVHDETRAQRRYIPASTFNIPHTLFALDAGTVRDELQVFPWDGNKRDIESWNGDQNLRSAMRNSVVWVYQHLARELGEGRERAYLKRIGYGNEDPSGGIDRFWLDGGLRISADEQIAFLKRLYRNELPFRIEHQRLVKDLMIVEAGPDWILRAKTGWGVRSDPHLGWWVGWVERPQGVTFFALNIDMSNGGADAPKRQRIVRAILNSMGVLEAS